MKKSVIVLLGVIGLHAVVMAQGDPPLLSPEERKAVDAQADEFNRSLMPALSESAKSTVRIWSGRRRLAYGTVVGDGEKVLTKWSEVARGAANLRVESAAGVVLNAVVEGVYEDEDLAVLKIAGSPLTPVKWVDAPTKLGAFLMAPQPSGKPAGFGVVSVLDRNLRDTDQAYLGVLGALDYTGPGVKIQEVAPQSGVAAAGIKPGSVILKVGNRIVSGVLELKNALVGVSPGSKVTLLVNDGGGERSVDVLLGSRPELPKFPGDRLRQMEQMGGAISRVRDSFGRVIQTDMRLQPDQVGGPVVDLKGRVVGISMARAGRTNSYVMPAAAVENLLKKDPQNPSIARNGRDARVPALPNRMGIPQPRVMPGNDERIRRHLEEMQRLMDYMREELEGIDPQR